MTPTTPTPDDLRARDEAALALLVRCETSLWRDDHAVLCFDLTEARAHIAARLDTLAAAEGENARLRGLFESEAATFHLTQQRNDAIARAETAERLAQLATAERDAARTARESAEQQLAAQAAELERVQEALAGLVSAADSCAWDSNTSAMDCAIAVARAALAPQAGGR